MQHRLNGSNQPETAIAPADLMSALGQLESVGSKPRSNQPLALRTAGATAGHREAEERDLP